MYQGLYGMILGTGPTRTGCSRRGCLSPKYAPNITSGRQTTAHKIISESQVVNGIAHDDCFVHTNRLIMVAVRNSTAGTKVAVFWNCKSRLQRTRKKSPIINSQTYQNSIQLPRAAFKHFVNASTGVSCSKSVK